MSRNLLPDETIAHIVGQDVLTIAMMTEEDFATLEYLSNALTVERKEEGTVFVLHGQGMCGPGATFGSTTDVAEAAAWLWNVPPDVSLCIYIWPGDAYDDYFEALGLPGP